MTFSMDFSNDKPSIRDLIPSGIPLFLEMTYAPGGVDVEGTPADRKEGALTQSQETDARYLKAEFTVLRGPYKGRKFWGNMTVSGGKLDEKGQSKAGTITRGHIRALIDSSVGLRSDDESPEANAKRVIRGFRDLQKRRFMALSKIETGKPKDKKNPQGERYDDKNTLGQILTLDMAKYPKSEQELDNPNIGTPAAPAAPAPVWGAGSAGDDAAQVSTPAPQANVVVPFAAPTSAPVVPPRAVQPDNGLPKWAA